MEMSEKVPPKINEYLPEAINKAVLDMSVKHPGTIYPVAIGASSGFVGWLFGMPILYVIALAGVLIGPAWAVSMIFFFHDRIGAKYLNQLNQQQKVYESGLKKSIEIGLGDCLGNSNLAPMAKQGIEQFKKIEEKLSNVHELLNLKIKSTEITFERFLGASEQVSLSVLDNLKDVVSLLKSAGSIDTDYIDDRLNEIEHNNEISEADQVQASALKKRLQLREDQINKVKIRIANNEEALTEMENISAAVAEWHTQGQFAQTDLESAINRLQELAVNAHEYNI